jgi:hypothetical protein
MLQNDREIKVRVYKIETLPVADLEGAVPPPSLSPEIYHQMLVKLKI